MRYLGEDELTDLMGIGYPGEVRVGPDGNLYQWEEGVDGLGNPVGFWSAIKKVAKAAAPLIPGGGLVKTGLNLLSKRPVQQALRRAAPYAAPFIPGAGLVRTGASLLRQRPVQQALHRAAPYAAPFIPGSGLVRTGAGLLRRRPVRRRFRRRRRGYRGYPYGRQGSQRYPDRQQGFIPRGGVSGYNRLRDQYQDVEMGQNEELYGLAEDEELYGLAEEEYLDGLGEDEMIELMGIGYPGEVRMGPDGNLYQWEEGVDGLGNPIGFWSLISKAVKKIVPERVRKFVGRALPIASTIAPFIPGIGPAVAAGLTTATPFLRRAGFAGYNGLGALYQAPDGTMYEVDGLGEDEELYGFGQDEGIYDLGEDEELYGLAEDEEFEGFAEDEDLYGLAQDEELYGLAQDEEFEGFAEDEELLGQGYVRKNGVSGLDAFVPNKPHETRWFKPPDSPPELWKPLW